MTLHTKIEQPEVGASVGYDFFAVQKRLKVASEFVDFSRKIVLDLGCGNGAYTVEIAKVAKKTFAVDIEDQRLAFFRRYKKSLPANLCIEIIKAPGEYLPFRSGEFDLVTMIEVLEHVSSEEEVLSEIYRVLKTNGDLILFVPNRLYPFETHGATIKGIRLSRWTPFVSYLPEPLHARIAHARIYTEKKLRLLIEEAGFKTVVVEYFYPPLDYIYLPQKIKKFYRQIATILENSFLRRFGVSLFMLARKT